MSADLFALLQNPARVAEVPPAEIPALLGELERLKAILWVRMVNGPATKDGQAEAPVEDRLLTVPQVAARLSVPKGYAYELARRREIPTVRVGAKYIRVSLAALRDWEARRQEKDLDKGLCVTHSNPHDGFRSSPAPKTARTHPGATGRADRRNGQQRRAMGARRDGRPRVGGAAHPAPGEDGAESQT